MFTTKEWMKDFKDQAQEMVNAYEDQQQVLKEKEAHMVEIQAHFLATVDVRLHVAWALDYLWSQKQQSNKLEEEMQRTSRTSR